MKELRDQLWDLVYGLLDEADAAQLRERITSDREVAREYARVKLRSELVGQAARANQAERDLPTPAERPRVAGSAHGLSAARLVAFSASLALSIGLLLFAGIMYWSDQTVLRGPAVAQALEGFEKVTPRLMVVGPPELRHDAPNTFDVTLETLNGIALVAPIEASLEDADGNTLWFEKSQTEADGKRRVQLPADRLKGEAVQLKINVEGESSGKQAESTHGATFSTWLDVNEQPGGDLVVRNRVSDGRRAFFSESEIHSHRYAKVEDSVDKMTENLSEKKKSASNGRDEADLALVDDANRVRWGIDYSEQESVTNKYFVAPSANDIQRLKEMKRNTVKQEARDLPVLAKGTQPARHPGASPRAESPRPDAINLPAPRESAPAPIASVTIAPTADPSPGKDSDGKEGKPAQTPAATGAPGPASELPELEQMERYRTEDETKFAERSKARDAGKLFVENITAGDQTIVSRMVDGSETATLEERIDEVRKEGLIADDFKGRVTRMVYDPSYAPPQKVAEASVDFSPTIEPLNCSIKFDRKEYLAGDVAEVELRVSNLFGEPQPAVLNVQVDAVPLSEVDAVEESPTQFLFASAASPRVPLVFDNGVEQSQKLNKSLANYLTERQKTQRHSALWLLGGSGAGFCLLLIAGCLKLLPKARFWLPVAALLACSTGLGTFWLRNNQPPTNNVIVRNHLTTYGVQSEPPPRSSQTQPSNEGRALSEPDLENLVRDEPTSTAALFDDMILPQVADTKTDPEGKTQTLLAMTEWQRLAENREDRPGLSTYPNGLGGPSRWDYFRGDLSESGAKSSVAELALEDTKDVPLGAPVDSLAAGMSGMATVASAGPTILWHPRVTTDAAGICKVQFQIPSGPLAYRLLVISHSGPRIGAKSALIPTVVANDRN